MTNIEKVYQSIANEKQRSAWDKGVTKYALELVEQLGEQIRDGYFDELDLKKTKKVRAALLNGARDWQRPDNEYAALEVACAGEDGAGIRIYNGSKNGNSWNPTYGMYAQISSRGIAFYENYN